MTSHTDKPADLTSREFRVDAQRMSRKQFGMSPRQAKRHAKLILRTEREQRAKQTQPTVH